MCGWTIRKKFFNVQFLIICELSAHKARSFKNKTKQTTTTKRTWFQCCPVPGCGEKKYQVELEGTMCLRKADIL